MKAQLKLHNGTPTVFLNDAPAFFGCHLIGGIDPDEMLLQQPDMRRYRDAGVHLYSCGSPTDIWQPHTAEVVYDLFSRQIVARDTAAFQVELPPASTTLYFTGPARLLPDGH